MGTDEQDGPGLGEVGEETLEDDLAEEPGDTREENPLSGQPVHDRTGRLGSPSLPFLYHPADYRPLPVGRQPRRFKGPSHEVESQ